MNANIRLFDRAHDRPEDDKFYCYEVNTWVRYIDLAAEEERVRGATMKDHIFCDGSIFNLDRD